MTFEETVNKLVGFTMIVGPILLVISTALMATDKLVPGIIRGFYGGVLLLVACLKLGLVVGRNSGKLGAACLVAGLLGGVVFIAATIEKLTREMLVREGVSEAALDAVIEEVPWQLGLIWINGLLFPLSWILIGAGLLRSKIVNRWEATALIAVGPSFFVFQGLGFFTDVGLVISMILLLIGIAPIGFRMIGAGPSNFGVEEPSPASM